MAINDRFEKHRFLIRDRDAKYSGPFDQVFLTEGVRIVKTPVRAPRANAFAERWVRTARRECVDYVLILGRRHLEQVLGDFVGHYNAGRPHRGLQLACPSLPTSSRPSGSIGAVCRRDRLGGLIHEYYREAAWHQISVPLRRFDGYGFRDCKGSYPPLGTTDPMAKPVTSFRKSLPRCLGWLTISPGRSTYR